MTATSRDLQPEPDLSQRLPAHVADVRSGVIDHLDATELVTLTAIPDKFCERLALLQPGA